jgi:hypothetical protein
MRRVFVRAVLLGALAALALAAARGAWAEITVVVCTSATGPSPLRIVQDTEREIVLVQDVARATQDLYPLSEVMAAEVAAMLAQLGREGRYQCRPGA